MKFVFTKHAKKKFKDFAGQGLKFSQKDVKIIVKSPEHVDKETDYPKLIASGTIGIKHVLRIVFKVEDDIITIITLYPAKKGRYYET